MGEIYPNPPDWDTLDRLVRDLHGEANASYPTVNIWNKLLALYPFLCGTPAAHSLNLIDPETFPITWYGSPTHTMDGVAFNGTSQYGATGINAALHLLLYDKSAGMYNKAHTATGNAWYWGAYNSLLFGIRIVSGECDAVGVNNYQGVLPVKPIGKFHAVDISSAGMSNIYNEGISEAALSPGNQAPDAEILIGGITGFRAVVDTQTFYVGKSLTESDAAAEHTALYNAIHAYNTALGRD